MCYSRSVEGLLSFGLSDINKILRREGYTLSSFETLLRGPSDYASSRLTWGEGGNLGEVEVRILKDSEGLALELRYYIPSRKRAENLRYKLEKVESNLLPGTYRYYIQDPYTEGGGLCSRLYLIPEIGEFVPRSILKDWRVLYRTQRRSRKDRYYYFSKLPETRYRKFHYRGRETPFGRRYQELQSIEDLKVAEMLVGWGIGAGVLPPDIEGLLGERYRKHTGRKSLSPLG